jgi:DNA-binding SARP family transcriptional activator
LAELVACLPANGHVVLAGREQPPVPLARLQAQRAAIVLPEDDLRFSEEELAQFAARRGVELDRFAGTGGWPAMAELTASVQQHLAGAYVWEEVLKPLGAKRRWVLAVVSDLGGADDDLAEAALGEDVELGAALAGVPLVAVGTDGGRVPHPLWRTVPALALEPGQRAEVRRRAVDHLLGQERFDEAFALVSEAGLWDLAPAVLRATCVAGERPGRELLRRWADVAPTPVLDTPAGRLAQALLAAATGVRRAFEPLQAAAAESRALGDVDAEVTALAELGRLAWWHQDLASVAPLMARVGELAESGHPLARGLRAFGDAVVADVVGDDDAVLAALAGIEPGTLDAGWTAGAQWMEARIRLSTGDPDGALSVLERIELGNDPAMRTIVTFLRLAAWWVTGRIDEVIAEMPRAAHEQADAGIDHNRRLALAAASNMRSHVGDVAAGRQFLNEQGPLDAGPLRPDSPPIATARASLALAEGDEEGATATLRDALAASALAKGINRRAWRGVLPLVYVLVPETREHWDAAPLPGTLEVARTLARAVVAARPGTSAAPRPPGDFLRDLDLPALPVVRANLHFRLAADLAVGLAAAGRREGATLLDALGDIGRDAVRTIADGTTGAAKPARALLAAVPPPPPTLTYLAVLGPLEVRRGGLGDGDLVTDPDLRRERVRALLAYLVARRSTTRAAITAALWPDLDERSAANNLRVTLNYLLRALEPWRPAGEPSHLIRSDGAQVELVTGPHLVIDTNRFRAHVDAAATAEADGHPSDALDHGLAAATLYRGELFADMTDAPWTDLDREHYRSHYVTVAVRSAQLLLGRAGPGDIDLAEATARRVLDVDPWAEDAYGVLASAALTRGDRAAARRHIDRCVTALADLGVGPSATTQRLRRRLRASPNIEPT